jgi:hypothetical protein
MNKIATFIFLFFTIALSAQEIKEKIKPQIVEAACGQCQFDMKGKMAVI